MTSDRFGNVFSPGVPYARGEIVSSTVDDLKKLRAAWGLMRDRIQRKGLGSVHILNGLERGMRIEPSDIDILDDEIAPALLDEQIRALGLEQLGGDPSQHDLMLCNRQTAALLVAADVMIKEGDMVVAVSPRYSHPAVVRAVVRARGRFTDCAGVSAFEKIMEEADKVDLVILTRLSVSYEILSEDDLQQVLRIANEVGARVLVDDAGGARVGPAVFGQSKMLTCGADVVCTGLDKYGTMGPRLGMVGGRREIVAEMRARAFEMGLEARPMLYPAVVRSLEGYTPERVRELVACTMEVRDALRKRLGDKHLWITPVTVQIPAEEVLELVMQRARVNAPPCVPYEATAGLAMVLLRDYGILTVHFAGMPPGTSALMIKFVPPETLRRLGGAEAMAEAIDASLTELSRVIGDPQAMRALLLGAETKISTVRHQSDVSAISLSKQGV